MKNSRKWFVITEAVLAVLIVIMVSMMFLEKNRDGFCKVSVIIQNSDDSQWSAFKYGLKMAAEDQGVEVFIVSTGGELTAEDEIKAINQEIEHGASAVIIQPVPGADMEELLKSMEKKIPVMLIESASSKEKAMLPVVEPDHYAMGKALAEELLEDYNGNINGKTLGIIAETEQSESVMNRRKGFEDVLKGTGAEICWLVSDIKAQTAGKTLAGKTGADFVIALDDSSLTVAGECAAVNDLHGALVYGIGNSTEAVYYLDTGDIKCLIVPDEFQAGYESLTETAENLEHFFHKMEGGTVSYTVIRREELFSKKNQEILFTMSQ